MILAIIITLALGGMCWIGFILTGALLTALLWLFVKIPAGLVMLALGAALCCTLIFIPIGIKCFGLGIRLILPLV